MIIKGLVDEDFVNYKKPSMFISTSKCTFKCEKECGIRCCQNNELVQENDIAVDDSIIVERYLNNPISKAIVIGGLEPFDQFDELYHLLHTIRNEYHIDDDIVIYSGYNEFEIIDYIARLEAFHNITIKYGRFIPDKESKYDYILGVNLASPNQYAKHYK